MYVLCEPYKVKRCNAAATKKVDNINSAICKTYYTILLYSTLVRVQLKNFIQFWVPLFQKGVGKLEGIQNRAI